MVIDQYPVPKMEIVQSTTGLATPIEGDALYHGPPLSLSGVPGLPPYQPGPLCFPERVLERSVRGNISDSALVS